MRGAVGFERVSDAAPFALWPGAGEGQVRAPLLRAHPLLSDGVVDLTAVVRVRPHAGVRERGSCSDGWSGRRSCGSASPHSPTSRARRVRTTAGGTPVQVDVGAGLRIKIPGTPGVLRADVAHGLRDGANALTFGWLF